MLAEKPKNQNFDIKKKQVEEDEYDRIMKKYHTISDDEDEQQENIMDKVKLSTHHIGLSSKINPQTPQKLKLIQIDVNECNISPTPSFQNTPQHFIQIARKRSVFFKQ